MNEPVFDPSREIAVNLPRFGLTATVTYPEFDDLVAYNGAIKVFQRTGKGAPESEGEAEAATELFSKIALEKDEKINPDAASVAVNFLLRGEPDEPETDASGLRIPLTVMGGIRTVHIFRMPTLKEERKYDNEALWVGERKFKRVQIRYSYPSVAALYDALVTGVEGYAGETKEKQLANVPVNHKHVALRALFDFVKASDEEGTPISFK